jgi:hypothetical protein
MSEKEEKKLERYSKICDDCAKEQGGVCYKEIVCYNFMECEICKKEASCLSAKDWHLPKD